VTAVDRIPYEEPVGIRFAASGNNTAVDNNEFKEHKDGMPVGLAPCAFGSHDDVIGSMTKSLSKMQRPSSPVKFRC